MEKRNSSGNQERNNIHSIDIIMELGWSPIFICLIELLRSIMTSKLAMHIINQLELRKIQAQIDFTKASDFLVRAKLNEEICGLNQIIQDYLEG